MKIFNPDVLEVMVESASPSSEKLDDANVVDFAGTDDPSDPTNRTLGFRWMHVAFVSFVAFLSYCIYNQ